jgi:hypothetical protein
MAEDAPVEKPPPACGCDICSEPTSDEATRHQGISSLTREGVGGRGDIV